MNLTRSHRLGLMGPLMSAVAAEAAASGSAPASTEVPSTNAAEAAPKARAPKNPDNILDIVNGRLPLPLVKLIRFDETGSNNEVAKKYGTSVGKVFDIKKGRNFGYVDAGYKPSADELKAAKDWLTVAKTNRTQKTLGEIMGAEAVAATVAKLDAMGVATAEEVGARNWVVKTVGQPAATGEAKTAPVAAAAAAAPAGEKTGAKLF